MCSWRAEFLSLATPSPTLSVPCLGRRLERTWNSKFVQKEGCVLSNLGKIQKDTWIFYSALTHKEYYKNINNFHTFNFSPVDSNFCYRYSQALSYIKKFHIKRPEVEQEIANTVTLIFRIKMVALLIITKKLQDVVFLPQWTDSAPSSLASSLFCAGLIEPT